MSSLSPVEEAKRAAAYQAIDDCITTDGLVIGVGSGSTIVYAVDRLAEKLRAGLKFTCIPTSFQAEEVQMCCIGPVASRIAMFPVSLLFAAVYRSWPAPE